jgi:hypothetical protein
MWFAGDGLMMAVALVIAGQWLTDSDRSSDTGAYLEAAGRSALASYGDGGNSDALRDSDDVDAARLAYNRMLAALASRPEHAEESEEHK